jgi:hypothetical protein
MMDADLLSNYGSVSGITEISKRFGLIKYAQWSEADLKLNERLLRQEKGLNPDGDDRDLPKLYSPDDAELGGFEGGFGGGGGSFAGGGGNIPDLDMGGEGGTEGGLDDAGAAGEGGGLPELGGDTGANANQPPAPNQKTPPQNSKLPPAKPNNISKK